MSIAYQQLNKVKGQKGSTIISVKKVSKSYGQKKVLDAISFDISAGEIFGLLGSNGAGKSTITKIMLGFELANKGKVVFFNGGPFDHKTKISIVPQQIAAYLDFTVQTNMEYFTSLTKIPKKEQKKRIDFLLNWLDLQDFKQMKIRYLSGGYQRLVNIALSLISDPEIIFLDEPTVGLDPKMRQMFWQKIKELQEAGKTIILTTHYMDEAERLCTKLVLLKNGKLIKKGRPKELIRNFGGLGLLELELDKRLTTRHFTLVQKQLPKNLIYLKNKTILIPYKQSQNFGEIISTTKSIIDAKYSIKSIYLKEPNLEDVFLNITGEKMGDTK